MANRRFTHAHHWLTISTPKHTPFDQGKPPAMNKRPTARQRAALETLLSLFGGMKRAMREQLQADGIPVSAPLVLRMLQLCQHHPGITQQGLVHLTGRDKGQVAKLVKELLEARLLRRSDNPHDKRSLCLLPTAAGLMEVARFEQAEAAVADRLFDDLGASELSALTEKLARLKDRLDGMPSGGSEA